MLDKDHNNSIRIPDLNDLENANEVLDLFFERDINFWCWVQIWLKPKFPYVQWEEGGWSTS